MSNDTPKLEAEYVRDETFFRNDDRLPEAGAPQPAGLRDAVTPELVDSARHLLGWIFNVFWNPGTLASWPGVWQWRKFELLDWLRPLELLLRRILLIEAVGLLTSQSLPAPKAAAIRSGKGAARTAPAKPACDPDHPERWRVSFSILPLRGRSGPRRRLPPIDWDHFAGDPRTPKRFRRVLHDALPLARRLEAALRVVLDPAAFARRLAFRLRRNAGAALGLIVIDHRKPRASFATDALALAGAHAGLALARLSDTS